MPVPGLHRPDSACEAHHITPWWAGGHTCLTNLVLLCPHHHTLVEPDRYNRPGDRWLIHIDPDSGRAVVTPPDRTTRFTSQAGPPPHGPPDETDPPTQAHPMDLPGIVSWVHSSA